MYSDKETMKKQAFLTLSPGTRSSQPDKKLILERMFGRDFAMQGTVYAPINVQTGSPPPQNNDVSDVNMEATSKPNLPTKEFVANQSIGNDSGIFSATMNSTYPSEPVDTSAHSSAHSDTDNRSDCSSPDRKYFCPICKTVLASQHEFTLHIRSHNNDGDTQDNDKGYVCRICKKALSSSSSLDRHVLVHSGERPFACKYCGDTFTTNGNMHRHVRTHSNKNDNYESDGSADSAVSSKTVEFNNNKVESKADSKRKLDEDENPSKIPKMMEAPNDQTQNYKCPVCERTDFNSLKSLETHFEDNHPDSPTNCNQCNQVFQNNRLLSVHRNTVHTSEDSTKNARNFVTGFKDLTFVDFSSEKFPHIARYQCEKSIHKVSGGLRFVCKKCTRAFPCAASLEIHEKDCTSGVDLNMKGAPPKLTESDIRRAEFFARLNLQNNLPEIQDDHDLDTATKLRRQLLVTAARKIDNSKDLADIQSIISMTTNGSILQHLSQKANDTNVHQKHNSETSSETIKNEQEEESQDVFATEFRKMKLRGEFPCRLCTAIFPNLRALKGHNRTHLNGTTNGTYHCNMCPHSSVDKAALVRHMRTHNGDRPYECSLCNYAFTTKANCERHLRNRHSKSTREEVKRSIIYHPSEDPTNDEMNKLNAREDTRKINLNFSGDSNELSPEKSRCSTPKIPLMPEIRNPVPEVINIPKTIPSALHVFNSIGKEHQPPFPDIGEIIHSENIKSLKEHRMKLEKISHRFPLPQSSFAPDLNNASTPQNLTSKIHVKNLETLKQNFEPENNFKVKDVDVIKYPVEQSIDGVLDLSKKKPCVEEENEERNSETSEDLPQDLSKKSPEMNNYNNVNEMFAQQIPKIDPHSWLALCRGGLNWPAFPINPLLLRSLHTPFLPHDHQEFKEQLERLQRLQLCGGGMITENFDRLRGFQPMANPVLEFNGLKTRQPEPTFLQNKQEDLKPLSLNVEQPFSDGLNKIHSPLQHQPKPDLMQSPNSVKMVIKNGVLMPKQKQRRYRTERPFSCEHCSARFTLRSNMERHIKQQHPQFWSQRQRTGVGNPGRKAQILPTNIKNNFCDLSIPNYEVPKIPDYEETKDQINDKLKYAILAHHLRNSPNFKSPYHPISIKKEDEEDCDLVIDETDDNVPKTISNVDDNNDNEVQNFSIRDSNTRILENKLKQLQANFENKTIKNEEAQDLVPVSRLLDNASQQQFKEYFKREGDDHETEGVSEEEEEGLVASGSTSEGNNSGTDENRSESENLSTVSLVKKKSAYSLAPNRVSCPYCSRKFPWTSSLRRHILTHTGQKPFKCSHCPLLFTTKSNCDRHLLRKHGNSATTINNDVANNNNNSNYMMRNVPERPFKCSSCPSSTFSTYSNLKKHISCKHSTNAQGDDIKAQGYEAGSSEDEKMTNSDQKNDWEMQITQSKITLNSSENQSIQMQNSDLPFKCHLCEKSFSERQEALDHIKHHHASEYDLLMSKNALDTNATTPDEATNHDEDDSEMRGKFPDYSNRKVICAFCMRRFWSAEDLRRHMRTHTGERPFSCDICRRRFTLKHSMLRHRKKHNVAFENDNANSDEDGNPGSAAAVDKTTKSETDTAGKIVEKTDESDGNEGGDLISNLLGLRDKSILDQVLTASADDAAKLLGVRNGVVQE